MSIIEAGETNEWTRKAHAGVEASGRFRIPAQDPGLHLWEQYLAALEPREKC